LVNEAISSGGVGPRAQTDCAYFLEGFLRTQVPWADEKDDAVHKSEGVAQHELFHFPVVDAAPVGLGQERPTDLDLAFLLVVSMESRGADDPAGFGIDVKISHL